MGQRSWKLWLSLATVLVVLALIVESAKPHQGNKHSNKESNKKKNYYINSYIPAGGPAYYGPPQGGYYGPPAGGYHYYPPYNPTTTQAPASTTTTQVPVTTITTTTTAASPISTTTTVATPTTTSTPTKVDCNASNSRRSLSSFFGLKSSFLMRVIGGTTAPADAYPYQVSIRSTADNTHYCGGSIISAQWILTAAHCVQGIDLSTLYVVTGTTTSDPSVGTTYAISNAQSNGYDPLGGNNNDIAVVRLMRPIVFGPNVQPVALARTDPSANDVAVFTGWGVTNQTDTEAADNLQQLCTKVISNTDCAQTFPDIDDSVICTQNQAGEGLCRRDSGSPLVVGDQQVGVATFGFRDCGTGQPDTYASVAKAFNWIQGITGVTGA